MANPAITVSVAGDTKQLYRDIESIVRKQYTLNFNTKGQPLGRITGQVTEFTKSLDAANARVIAFGASAGVIVGIEKAFRSLVNSTIEVQKSLTDINVILNASGSQLQKFGSDLFNVAKNTGASFQTAAEAATEFSRQGLGLEETLKRTNEALILSRLSGLGAAQSVETLTAAVNSFASQGITATQVVNKLANVDAAFAVSSKDLAEGISRVGASASQSGISIDELIALITSAQQVTARGGAVIGNSFKTIFTRLERGKTLSLLESLGIKTTDESGIVKNQIQLLKDLARTYDSLDSGKKAEVAEKVGGVFQINILKAALGDLSKEYSIYSQAVDISKTSTDEAIQRNEALNQTYAAQLNALRANITQLSANAGEKLFGPSMKRVIGGANDLLGGINESDGTGVGAKLANGILTGLGQVLAGPGLAVIGGVLLKLVGDFAKFGSGSVKELLGLNTASKEQKAIQESIGEILQKNPELMKLMTSESVNSAKAAQAFLTILKEQTVQMEKQSALTASISKQLYTGGVRIGAGGVPVVRKAGGYIPNFADDDQDERIGALMHGYKPGVVSTRRLFDGKGGSFLAKTNSAEKIVDFKNGAGNRATMVIPPNGFGQDAIAAAGYIPNFALSDKDIIKQIENGQLSKEAATRLAIAIERDTLRISTSGPLKYLKKQGLLQKYSAQISSLADKNEVEAELGKTKKNRQDKISDSQDEAIRNKRSIKSDAAYLIPEFGKNFYDRSFGKKQYKDFLVTDIPVRGINGPKEKELALSTANKPDFLTSLKSAIFPEVSEKVNEILSATGLRKVVLTPEDIEKQFDSKSENKGAYGALQAFGGSAFEVGFTRGLQYSAQKSNPDTEGDFDVRGGSGLNTLQKIFDFKEGKADFKASVSPANMGSFANKVIKEYGGGAGAKEIKAKLKGKAAGYIPNFADALHDSIAREIGAGAPKSGVYVKQYSDLSNSDNPLGLGVFNNRDEGSVSSEKRAMRKKGYARGYIPNFADSGSSDTGSTLAAVGAELSSIAFILAANRQDIGKVFTEEIETRKVKSSSILQQMQKEINDKKESLAKSNSLTEEEISKRKAAIQRMEQGYAQELKNTKLSAGNALGAASKASGSQVALAASFLGPIISSTLASSIDQTTKEGRANSEIVSGIGGVVSGAATGAMMFGPLGAAIGGTVASLGTLDSYLKQINTDLPELSEKTKQASEENSRFQEAMSKIMTLEEKLNDVRQQQGGALNTKEQLGIIGQIKEASGALPSAIQAKIAASNYDFESVKEILVKEATINVEKEKTARTNEAQVKRIEASKDQGFLASFGRFFLPKEDNGPLYQTGEKQAAEEFKSEGTLERVLRGIITLGISEIAGNRAVKDVEMGRKEAQNIAKQLAPKYIESAGATGDPYKLQKLYDQLTNPQLSKNITLEEILKKGGFSDEARRAVYKNEQITLEDVKSFLASEIGTSQIDNSKQIQASRDFNQEYGDIADVLDKFKTSLLDFIQTAKITANNIPKEQKFGYDFSLGRRSAMAESIGEMGFTEMSRNMSIQNDYISTIGKAKFEAQNNLSSKVIEMLTGNMESLVPSGKIKNTGDFEKSKQSLFEQLKTISDLTGKTDKNLFGDIDTTLKKIADTPTKKIQTSFGTSQIYDTNKIIEAVSQSENFKAQYKDKEIAKAQQELRSTIEAANEKIIESDRDLATKAAAQMDSLIKIQLQQLDKIGGGIDKVLNDKGPQSGKALEKAALGYGVVQANPNATDIQKGREALQTGRGINELMGGLPVISSDSRIFEDVTKGISQGLEKDFEAARYGLSKTQGGQEQIESMQSRLLDLTGQKDMKSAFDEVAKYQAAKALNLDDREAGGLGQKLYDARVASARKRLSETDAGKEELAAFDRASKITMDPGALATEKLREQSCALLAEIRDSLKSRVGPDSAPAQQMKNEMYSALQGVDLTPPAAKAFLKESATKAASLDYNVNVGVNLANAAQNQLTQGAGQEIKQAVESAVQPILQKLYNDMQKMQYQVNNGKSAPPSSSTSAPDTSSSTRTTYDSSANAGDMQSIVNSAITAGSLQAYGMQ